MKYRVFVLSASSDDGCYATLHPTREAALGEILASYGPPLEHYDDDEIRPGGLFDEVLIRDALADAGIDFAIEEQALETGLFGQLDPVEQESQETPAWADHWRENPDYPHADWRAEVANGDTLLGYHDWVEQRQESAEEGDPESTQLTSSR